jgi:hypothetical protein
MTHWRAWFLAWLLAMASVAAAGAHPPAHYDPALHQWFENLRQPGSGIGCCAESDCKIMAPGDWRQTGGGYQIRVRDVWYDVPPERILEHEPNPTGSVVACYRTLDGVQDGSRVIIFCFVRGTEA